NARQHVRFPDHELRAPPMKLLLMPTDQGSDWWVLTHDLTVEAGRTINLRPIHVVTFLAHYLAKPERRTFIYSLALGLENKIAAVKITHERVRSTWSRCGDPGRDPKARIKGYDDQQEVIAAIEAFLGSIYSTLETVAFLNAQLNPAAKLRQSFSE